MSQLGWLGELSSVEVALSVRHCTLKEGAHCRGAAATATSLHSAAPTLHAGCVHCCGLDSTGVAAVRPTTRGGLTSRAAGPVRGSERRRRAERAEPRRCRTESPRRPRPPAARSWEWERKGRRERQTTTFTDAASRSGLPLSLVG